MTPEQIKKLIDSGKLTPADVELFSPQEKSIYDKMISDRTPSQGKMDLISGGLAALNIPQAKTGAIGALGGLGLMAAPGSVAGAAKGALSMGGTMAGMYALEKAAENKILPRGLVTALEMGLGLKAALSGKSGAGPIVAAEEKAAAGPTTKALESLKQKIVPRGNVTRGRTLDPLAAGEGGEIGERVLKGGVKIERSSPSAATAVPDVPQRGYADIALRDAYPRNVTTQSNTDDLLEMITRSSSKGSPSPLMVHDDDELRKVIDAIKNLKRR